jgi:predicted ATPase
LTEPIQITPEQMAEYQRQQLEKAKVITQHCVEDLAELGYEIIAVPGLTSDGRITATVAVQRKAQ